MMFHIDINEDKEGGGVREDTIARAGQPCIQRNHPWLGVMGEL